VDRLLDGEVGVGQRDGRGGVEVVGDAVGVGVARRLLGRRDAVVVVVGVEVVGQAVAVAVLEHGIGARGVGADDGVVAVVDAVAVRVEAERRVVGHAVEVGVVAFDGVGDAVAVAV